jgi:hypothetical protein
LLWLMALSPMTSCSIRWVSAPVFLTLKQNLMQIFAPSYQLQKNRRITKT